MRTVEVTQSIVFNGKEYTSVEEMPAEERRLYEEALRQAGPLLAQGGWSGGGRSGVSVSTSVQTRILYNGREYSGPEELPADVREQYERAMAGARPGRTAAAGEGPGAGLRLDARFSARPIEPGAGPLSGRVAATLIKFCAAAVALWILLKFSA